MITSRRFFQISIRGLVVTVALVAMGLGVFVNGAMRQRAAIRAIEAVNGRVLYDFNETQQGYFDPNATSHKPQWLLSTLGVDYLHPVVFVDFDSPKVTDDSLDILSGLPQLGTLHISNTSITSEGFARITGLSHLHTLTLNTDGINDLALIHISSLPALAVLECHSADISDEGIASLQTMKRLKRLWLDDCNVSEQGIERLKTALPNCKIEW